MNMIRLNKEFVNAFWKLRRQLFEELGEISAHTDIAALEVATKEYYLSHIDKDLISWGILAEGKIVAAGSLCLFARIPYQENLTGKEGYILNIYTCPSFRKQGLAKSLLDEMIKYAAATQIKRLWLNSSESGKYLYVERGFSKKDNEMELFL